MPRSDTWFPKGQSGNPSGRPKLTAEVREAIALARQYAPEAMRQLIELGHSKDPKVAIRALQLVLDRSLGAASALTLAAVQHDEEFEQIELATPEERIRLLERAIAGEEARLANMNETSPS